jgi:hypothetical protein
VASEFSVHGSEVTASVFINDKSQPGNHQKKLMQVKIPVTKVDFESRTIDNQRGSRGGTADSANMSSAGTSSSGSGSSFSSSSYNSSRQVDLSDLYADPSASSNSDQRASTASGMPANTLHSTTAGASSTPAGGTTDNSAAAADQYNNSNDSSTTIAAGSQGTSGYSSEGGNGGSASGNYSSDTSEAATQADPYAANSESAVSEDRSDEKDPAGNQANLQNRASGNGDGPASDDQGSTSSTEYAQNGSINESGRNEASSNNPDDDISDSSGQTSSQTASARDQNVEASQDSDSQTSNPQSPSSEQPPAVADSQDPFLMAVSIKSEKNRIFQSFDFIEQTNQTSTAIPAGSEITFSLNMSKKVDPESVSIKISDGTQEFSGNIKNMGESFAYVFAKPSSASFIQLSGKAEGKSFIYRLTLPVTQK